jgi:hypothetical protein
MRVREWATHKLRPGDLTALAALAGGSKDVDEDRIKRLHKRRFIIERGAGAVAVTLRGRVALMIRRVTPR